jgi:MaoC dehydratase-like protein
MESLRASAPFSWITTEMRLAVGRVLQRRASYPISESDVRRWAVATYHPDDAPRRYWDTEYAAATPWGGIVAPEDFNPFTWMPASSGNMRLSGDTDYVEKALGILGPRCRVQLNGGWEAYYCTPMRPGDVIMSVVRLVEYRERRGRLGLMLFTVTEDVWNNQSGEQVKRGALTTIRYS